MQPPRDRFAFAVWDVVRVPFAYTDRPVRQRRPALVIAMPGILVQPGMLWALMITSADNRGWPGDVVVSDLLAAGLPAARRSETTTSPGQPRLSALVIMSAHSMPGCTRMPGIAITSAGRR